MTGELACSLGFKTPLVSPTSMSDSNLSFCHVHCKKSSWHFAAMTVWPINDHTGNPLQLVALNLCDMQVHGELSLASWLASIHYSIFPQGCPLMYSTKIASPQGGHLPDCWSHSDCKYWQPGALCNKLLTAPCAQSWSGKILLNESAKKNGHTIMHCIYWSIMMSWHDTHWLPYCSNFEHL